MVYVQIKLSSVKDHSFNHLRCILLLIFLKQTFQHIKKSEKQITLLQKQFSFLPQLSLIIQYSSFFDHFCSIEQTKPYHSSICIFTFSKRQLTNVICKNILLFITIMLKSYKSSLQLNSYKIDTTSYEEKLHLLTRENEQLKSAIHQYKTKENRLIQELKSTKQENNSLRIKIRTQTAQIQANCRNCSKLQHQLREFQNKFHYQLQQETEKVKQYKEMYENELQNKKSAAEYYQKKLHSLLRDKDVLIKKYQDKIKMINSQQNLKSQPHLDSTTSIQRFFSPKKEPSTFEQPIQQNKFQRSARKLPPSPQRINQNKQNSQNQKNIKGKKASEQQLQNLLIPFLQRLQKMNLTLKELKMIQQIDRFSQAGVVAKNKFIKLMRQFPFECQDQNLIQLSFEYIVTTLRNSRLEETGKNIIQFMMNKIESIEEQEQQQQQQ